MPRAAAVESLSSAWSILPWTSAQYRCMSLLTSTGHHLFATRRMWTPCDSLGHPRPQATTVVRHHPRCRSLPFFLQNEYSTGSNRSSVAAANKMAAETAQQEASLGRLFRKAPTTIVKGRPSSIGLFPWRHSPRPLQRLDPDSEAFEEHGFLLGGNVRSSNPVADSYATAFLFLKVPFLDCLFFQAFKDGLAESMSWAFAQGVSAMLSNVYHRE